MAMGLQFLVLLVVCALYGCAYLIDAPWSVAYCSAGYTSQSPSHFEKPLIDFRSRVDDRHVVSIVGPSRACDGSLSTRLFVTSFS